jgi:hypothetical protein
MSQLKLNDKGLQDLYFKIIEGFSPAFVKEEQVWIKHFSLEDQSKIDKFYDSIYKDAREKGLPREKDLIEKLIEDGFWSEEEQKEITQIQKVIDGLRLSLSKAVSDKLGDVVRSNIKNREEAMAKLEEKRKSLLHDTCEDFADKRSNDLVIKLSFCKNKEGDPYLSDEEFEYLERVDIFKMVGIYNEATVDLEIVNIKRITAMDFFTSFYSLVEDNPTEFFKKPVHELTFFQLNLLNYGKLINSIYKNLSPPDHIRNDALALIAFAESESKKRKKEQNKPRGRGRT